MELTFKLKLSLYKIILLILAILYANNPQIQKDYIGDESEKVEEFEEDSINTIITSYKMEEPQWIYRLKSALFSVFQCTPIRHKSAIVSG